MLRERRVRTQTGLRRATVRAVPASTAARMSQSGPKQRSSMMHPNVRVEKAIMSLRPCVQVLCAVLFLLGGNQAAAVCSPTHVYEVYVGDTASDSSCTYNSIQDALDATYVCPTTIRITREHLWTSQHLSVNNKNLILQGEADGVSCYQMANCIPAGGCHAATTTPLVTLDGNNSQGQSSDRVLDITGASNITLRDLTIEHGVLDSFGHGGGISFSGSGSLTLDTTSVISNTAGYGGGIFVNGTGDGASLALKAHTLIALNTASHNGGGIDIEGTAHLSALESPASIFFNHAPAGDGGGLMIVGPAYADLAAHTNGGTALVDSNDAAYGGGITVYAGPDDGDGSFVDLFTLDPQYPTGVSGNVATQTGGGIYLKPAAGESADGGFSSAGLCAQDFQIDGNGAQEGAAIYADTDSYNLGIDHIGGDVYLNTGDCTYPVPAVACAAGVPCNTISNNIAQDGAGNPTAGSTILVQTGGIFHANRVILRANQGAHVLRGVDANYFILANCLMADNQVSGELVRKSSAHDGTELDLIHCTLAHDTMGGGSVITADSASEVALKNLIVDEPGVPTLDYGGSDITVNYVLSNDTSTLSGTGVVQGEPVFVDSANGDYHLASASLGLDYAPGEGSIDLDGLPRSVDLPYVTDVYGPRDLGAYERQLACAGADTIFCDGFDGN